MKLPRELFGLDQEVEKTEEQPPQIETLSPRHPSEEVLESREVTGKKELGGGANRVDFVKLKDNGDAVFKPKTGETELGANVIGTGYKRERAAYLVDLFLGLDLVPPTIIREIGGEIGSVQEFVVNSQSFKELSGEQRSVDRIRRQILTMELFDFIIANGDRHFGNFLVDRLGKLSAIDHGDTFHTVIFLGASIEGSHDPEIVVKIKSLARSDTKKNLLRRLLRELLSGQEVEACIQRIELLAVNFENDSITTESRRRINIANGYTH